MDHFVVNITPNEIHSKRITEYPFTFLNHSLVIKTEKYYDIILSSQLFKLKNIYNFLFLRTLKINKKFPMIRKMKINKYINSHKEFNQELSEYIQEEKLYAIIIMNGIQQFFIPIISN
jgi:hypothetical protein|tara:strand:- start:274 stop:627 length:354 start_codon:yes stop_codon:yes gene_type:complete